MLIYLILNMALFAFKNTDSTSFLILLSWAGNLKSSIQLLGVFVLKLCRT